MLMQPNCLQAGKLSRYVVVTERVSAMEPSITALCAFNACTVGQDFWRENSWQTAAARATPERLLSVTNIRAKSLGRPCKSWTRIVGNRRFHCANKVGDLLTAPCSRPTCQLGVKSLLIAINHSQTDRPRAFSSPCRGECWALSYRLCVFHAFCVIYRPIMIKILMQIVSNCTSLNFLGG